MQKTAIYKWLQILKADRESFEDIPRSGWPVTYVIPENISPVEDVIEKYHPVTIQEIGE